ncbi:unnamed protein product [Hyaloperonospora brassicae]|uniref:RxLR effector protein n=1 Tax=Hyaloperonospora brassicae TaxID=162125 RepID=A0AAV0UJG1_HYABA|nr:unnamed protein product [Hyaloperonospora brassicae]
MRVTSVFRVTTAAAAALLLAGCTTQSVESKAASGNARFQSPDSTAPSVDRTSVARSLKSMEAAARAAPEERTVAATTADAKSIDSKLLGDMSHDKKHAEKVFSSWLRNGQDMHDIEKRLTTHDLVSKYRGVLDQYDSYCHEHVGE